MTRISHVSRTPVFAARANTSLTIALAMLCGHAVRAQEDAHVKELKELRSIVQQLEKSLQEVRARIADVEQQHGISPATNVVAAAQANSTNQVPGSNYMVIAGQKIDLPAPATELSPQGRSPIRDHDTFDEYQQAAPRPDNKPIEPASVGFIPIPGTKSMVRFGGSARLDAIYDFAANGNPNQFLPSTIPVTGQAGEDGGGRSTLHAKATRISFEARRPFGEDGALRVFNENDFFNDSSSSSMSFRVRHFYGQARNLLVAQTYSAFMDIDAWADVLNYIGPSAIMNRR